MKELHYALEAAAEFEKEHKLPLLAILATWSAVQQRSDKILPLDKLMGTKNQQDGSNDNGGLMSPFEMVANLNHVHTEALRIKKENEESGED